MAAEPIEAIREEFKRLRATRLDVGPVDCIGVEDRGDGYALLKGSPVRNPDSTGSGGPTRSSGGCAGCLTTVAPRSSAPSSLATEAPQGTRPARTLFGTGGPSSACVGFSAQDLQEAVDGPLPALAEERLRAHTTRPAAPRTLSAPSRPIRSIDVVTTVAPDRRTSSSAVMARARLLPGLARGGATRGERGIRAPARRPGREENRLAPQPSCGRRIDWTAIAHPGRGGQEDETAAAAPPGGRKKRREARSLVLLGLAGALLLALDLAEHLEVVVGVVLERAVAVHLAREEEAPLGLDVEE